MVLLTWLVFWFFLRSSHLFLVHLGYEIVFIFFFDKLIGKCFGKSTASNRLKFQPTKLVASKNNTLVIFKELTN